MHDPIEIIHEDHRKLEELFKEYEDLESSAYESKEKLVRRIRKLMRLHMSMEEKIFYARAEDSLEGENKSIVQEGIAEHDVAQRILEELSVTHPEDPQFYARVKVLSENTAHHIMEEEEELLPKVQEKISSEDLATLGEAMHFFRIEHEDMH